MSIVGLFLPSPSPYTWRSSTTRGTSLPSACTLGTFHQNTLKPSPPLMNTNVNLSQVELVKNPVNASLVSVVFFHGILLSDTGSGAPNDGSSRSAGVSTGPSRRSARRIGQIRVAECSFIEQQDTPIQGNTPEVSSLNKVMDPGGGGRTHPHYGPQSLPLHSVTSNHASK